MSEELVPVSARLPIYHRFPHISVEYSLGEWDIKIYHKGQGGIPEVLEAPLFSKICLKINTFVFESGAGIMTVSLNSVRKIHIGNNL